MSAELSLASSFPKMAAMEEEHGGLVKAMVARMKERRRAKREVEERRRRGEEVGELTQPGGPAGPGGTLTSFRQGLDTLPDAAARELGEVGAVRGGGGGVGAGWGRGGRVRASPRGRPGTDGWCEPGRARHSGRRRGGGGSLSPGRAASLGGWIRSLARRWGRCATAGLAVVALGFDAEAMGGAPDGFGFLVPRGTGPRILGCLWDSSIFPGRAPDGKVLMRVMIGGAHDPEAVGEEEEALLARVRGDLKITMGLRAEPHLARVYRWPLGIGQYTVGHGERMEEVQPPAEGVAGPLGGREFLPRYQHERLHRKGR